MCAKDLITLQTCLSGREDPENSFHHCGGPVRLVQACLCAGKDQITTLKACLSGREDPETVFTTVEVL